MLLIKKIIFFSLTPDHSSDVKETIYRKINLVLIKANNSTDIELLKGVQDLIKSTLNSESYKWVGLDLLESATFVYSKTPKFIANFYIPIYLPFFKEYIG